MLVANPEGVEQFGYDCSGAVIVNQECRVLPYDCMDCSGVKMSCGLDGNYMVQGSCKRSKDPECQHVIPEADRTVAVSFAELSSTQIGDRFEDVILAAHRDKIQRKIEERAILQRKREMVYGNGDEL